MTEFAFTGISDAELITKARAGDREAYGELVQRYQSLVCSVAYSACGNVAQSEDIAQETFLTTWQQLAELREPLKFKSWLCGIARNLVNNALRREGRGRVLSEEVSLHEPNVASPQEEIITREEEQILWRTLDIIPETYREPLILFYRENQSIQSVAEALDLSEDAVKQRLSRGRQMLKHEVSSLVENTLRKSRPGKAFTMGVLLAISGSAANAAMPMALAVKAVSTAGTAITAKGIGALKPLGVFGVTGAVAGSFWGWVGGILGGVIGVVGGFLGIHIPSKIALLAARSARERRSIEIFTRRMYWLLLAYTLITYGFVAMFFMSRRWERSAQLASAVVFILLGLAFIAIIFMASFRYGRELRRIRREDNGEIDPVSTPAHHLAGKRYRSKITLLGLPLVDVAIGVGSDGHSRRGIAKGWIAIGDAAFGVLFALGGVAVGTVAIGGIGCGLFTIAGVALGGVAFGGAAIGYAALGGLAIGAIASGGAALALQAAEGGFAVAQQYAIGGLSYAEHANDQVARAWVADSIFFRISKLVSPYSTWLVLLTFVPVFFSLALLRKLRSKTPQA